MKTHTTPIQPHSARSCIISVQRSMLSFGTSTRVRRPSVSAFTLAETLVATLIAGVMLSALFTGLATAFSTVQATRENLRATQILVQRMEAVRLASYNTLQNPAVYPTNSTEYYCPSGQTGAKGAAYSIQYNWTNGPSTLPPSYRSNMMLVTITASWNSGNVQRSRSMQSYVARYGIQRYVAAN